MNRIGVVGLGWRQESAETLARYTLPKDGRGLALGELAEKIGAKELVYLATCNRVELVFVIDDDSSVDEYRRRIHRAMSPNCTESGQAQRELRAWQGEGAVEHLLLVTMGLDSAQVGESEILGQVREALDLAQAEGLAGDRLLPLFQKALKLAKRARQQTELHLGRTSLAEIGLDQVRADLVRRPGRVALIGVSPMTERCARELIQEGGEVLLVNRTLERAQALAHKLGTSASALALAEFCLNPPPISALISATGREGPVLAREELARLRVSDSSGTRPLLVDFATDPDLDPEAAEELGFDRLGMPEMLAIAERSRERRLRQSGEARSLVDEALQNMSSTLSRRKAESAIGAIREAWLAKANTEAEALIRQHFQEATAEQEDALRHLIARLAKRFAHIPSNGLRTLAQTYGEQVIPEFFEKSGADLASSIEDALNPNSFFAGLVAGMEETEAQ